MQNRKNDEFPDNIATRGFKTFRDPPGYDSAGRDAVFKNNAQRLHTTENCKHLANRLHNRKSCGQLPIVSLLIGNVTNCPNKRSSLSHHKCESHLNCWVDLTCGFSHYMGYDWGGHNPVARPMSERWQN